MVLRIPRDRERFTKEVEKWCNKCEGTFMVHRASKTCPSCNSKSLVPKVNKK